MEDPRGRALARAAAALDVGPVGQLTHRYQKSEELGLTRMLDQLDRRRRSRSKDEGSGRGQNSQRGSELATKLIQTPQTSKSSEHSSELENLGKLPNEPNGLASEGRSEGSENLGTLPNEPNDLGTAEGSDGSGDLGKLPNEPNDLGATEGSDGSGDLGKLPNEPNADLIADQAGELGEIEGFPFSGLPSVAGV